MQKISQKELLQEGFLDKIRKITGPIAKGVAGAAGLAKGVAKVVAPNLSREIRSDIDQFKSIGKGAKDAFTSEKNKQIQSTPQRFLENQLKTKWSKIFDPNSIVITAQQDAVPAYKLSKINKYTVYFKASKYKSDGSMERKEFNSTILRGNDGKFELVEIKDESGNVITASDSIKGVKNYDSSVAPYISRISNPNSPLLSDYATVIQRAFNLSSRELKDITNNDSVVTVKDALMIITNKQPGDNLDQNDINIIKKVFKDNLIAENSQIKLLKQLILLNDSYNKPYELSKHKNY